MNSFIFRPVRLAFAVRFARSRAGFAGLPGSGGLHKTGNCGKLPVFKVMQYPQAAGSGVRPAPRWGWGQSPQRKLHRHLSTRKMPHFRYWVSGAAGRMG